MYSGNIGAEVSTVRPAPAGCTDIWGVSVELRCKILEHGIPDSSAYFVARTQATVLREEATQEHGWCTL